MTWLALLIVVLAGLDVRFQRGQVGVASISLQELVAYPTAYLLVLRTIRRIAKSKSPHFWIQSSVQRAVAAYAIWILIAAVASGLARQDFDGLHALKDSLPGLILFWAFEESIRTPSDLRKAYASLAVMLVSLSLLGFSQYRVGWPYVNPVDPNALFKKTLTGVELVNHPAVGTMGSPNTFAVFMAPLIVIVLAWVWSRERDEGPRLPVILRTAISVVLLGGLALTFAKATVGCTVLGIAIVIIGRAKRLHPRPIHAIVTAACAFLIAGGLLFLALQSAGALPDWLAVTTLVDRLLLDQMAVELIRSSWATTLFGGALRTFTEHFQLNLGVHNEFVRQVLQAGIPGSALFVGVLWQMLRCAEGSWRYTAAWIVLTLVFLVESAAGSQLQSMIMILVAFTSASQRIRSESVAPVWSLSRSLIQTP